MDEENHMEDIDGLALLVLDTQPAFINAVKNPDIFRQRVDFIVSAGELLGIPMVLTEQVPDKLGNTDDALRQRFPPENIFPKTSFSAMEAPGIDDWLQSNQIRHLLVAGLETPICIYQTLLDAIRMNYVSTLLTDATAARRPEDAERVFKFLERQEGIFLLPSESVFYALLRNVKHPAFREFTRLVKEASNPPGNH